jgi:hypothetical protein
MKLEIFKHNGNGLVVSSRVVARGLNKRHCDVLESIDNIFSKGVTEKSVDLKKLIIPSIHKTNKNIVNICSQRMALSCICLIYKGILISKWHTSMNLTEWKRNYRINKNTFCLLKKIKRE